MTIDYSALEFLDSQSKKTAEVVTVGSHKYSASPLHLVDKPLASPMMLNTLQGIVDYIKTQSDTVDPLVLHVASPTEVTLFGSVNGDKKRDKWIISNAIIPEFRFGQYEELESFLIKIRAGFQMDDKQQYALKLLGSITEKNVVEQKDEGLSQAVSTRKTLVTGEMESVPGRIALAPYRTFVEVEQPVSEFVLRLKKVKITEDESELSAMLVEADGGAWRIAAKENIKRFFKEQLTTVLADHRVILIG